MNTEKFDTCIFRTKEKHPRIIPPHVCGKCPQNNEDVYKCIKLLIDGVNPDICLSCVHFVKGDQ